MHATIHILSAPRLLSIDPMSLSSAVDPPEYRPLFLLPEMARQSRSSSAILISAAWLLAAWCLCWMIW